VAKHNGGSPSQIPRAAIQKAQSCTILKLNRTTGFKGRRGWFGSARTHFQTWCDSGSIKCRVKKGISTLATGCPLVLSIKASSKKQPIFKLPLIQWEDDLQRPRGGHLQSSKEAHISATSVAPGIGINGGLKPTVLPTRLQLFRASGKNCK